MVGRPMRSEMLGETLLPKKIALPAFASDALSSVAYATEEILLVLSAGGLAFATRRSCCIAAIGIMTLTGLLRIVFSSGIHAESEHYQIVNTSHYNGMLLVFLLLRAFASGCTALTGVEAISNGVPAFKKPKSKNAATTLALLGAIAVSMFAGVTALALAGHVHAADAANLSGLPAGQEPRTVIAQVARSVFGGSSPLFYLLRFVTALILVLAANTAFNGFPVLASILARDGYLPRPLHTRGAPPAVFN